MRSLVRFELNVSPLGVTDQEGIASPSKCHYIRSEADRTIAEEAPALTAERNDPLGNWHPHGRPGK